MNKIKSLINSLVVGLFTAITLLSISASANITVLAWPGGPAEEALRKVVDHYNKTSDSKAELLTLVVIIFLIKCLLTLQQDQKILMSC